MFAATVLIECEGGFPERFLNEAAGREVALWDVSRRGISLFCRCKAADYRTLRVAARAASVRMRVRERCGLPFLLRPFRLRWGLLAGTLVFVLLLQLLSSRVWIVRIVGNEQVTDEAIREVLRPLGIYEGASPAVMDLPALQLTALERLPDIVWLTVNVEGSTATVEVRERQQAQPIAPDEPANVVAARDGVIVRVDAVSGQSMVKVGDAVTEGTLLISGVMDSKVGPLLKHAAGVVTARTTRTLTVTVPFAERIPSPTPRTISRPCLYLFGWRIPLYAAADIEGTYTQERLHYPLCAGGKALPVGMEVTRLTFDETVICTRSETEARTVAHARLAEAVGALDVMIEAENVTERKTDEGWVLTGTYTCLEEIGETRSLERQQK